MMIVVAIIGILAAVAIPAFIKYIRKSKTTEAAMNISKLYESTVAYYLAEHADINGNILGKAFPTAQAVTPALATCCASAGKKCAPVQAQWSTPTWMALNFSVDDPHYYSYLTTNTVGTGAAINDRYDVKAQGDLDCNAAYSLFQRSATVDTGFTIRGGSGLYIVNEIE